MNKLVSTEPVDFLRFCRSERRLAPMTSSAYERDVSACLGHLQGEGIAARADVKVTHLRAFLAIEQKTRPAASSQARTTALLKCFFRFLVEERLLRDPARLNVTQLAVAGELLSRMCRSSSPCRSRHPRRRSTSPSTGPHGARRRAPRHAPRARRPFLCGCRPRRARRARLRRLETGRGRTRRQERRRWHRWRHSRGHARPRRDLRPDGRARRRVRVSRPKRSRQDDVVTDAARPDPPRPAVRCSCSDATRCSKELARSTECPGSWNGLPSIPTFRVVATCGCLPTWTTARCPGGSRRYSSWSSCATGARTASVATRTGCGSGSGSRPRFCATRNCCFWTSRRPGSTLPACGICASWSSGWPGRGSRSSSRAICVAIIRKGRIVYEGRLDKLLATATASYRLRTSEPERARRLLLSCPGVADIRLVAGGVQFQLDEHEVEAMTIAFGEARIGFSALIPQTATLEELFLEMTGPADSVGGRRMTGVAGSTSGRS